MDYYIIVFVFGLIIGSFLNCVIYRMEEEKSFLKGRSFCPHCKHVLAWQDLIPVLSYIFLLGKCRYCKDRISWQYPAVELATGSLFVLLLSSGFLSQFWIIDSLFFLVSACLMIIIFVFDLKHYIIPDKIIYPAIAIAFFRILFLRADLPFLNYLLSALVAAAFFLAVVLITRGKGMGVGDIKLVFFMGLLLGYPDIIAALFLAFLIGAIIGIGMISAKKKTLKSEIPFGPFLIIGTILALLWGRDIIFWYVNTFLS